MTSHSSKLTQGYEHRPVCFQNHTCSPCPAATHRSVLGAQGLPVASTSTFQSSPLRCPTVASQPHWSTSCPGSTSQSCICCTRHIRHRKMKALDFKFPRPGVENLHRRCTLHHDPTCIFSACRCGRLTSPHIQAFPRPPPRWPPPSFPTGPLWELPAELVSSAPPCPPDVPFPELPWHPHSAHSAFVYSLTCTVR